MRKVAIALAAMTIASGVLAEEARARADATSRGEMPGSAEKLAGFFGRTKGITRLVPPSDVWEGISSGKSRYFVVDVRPADDFAKGHVPGALNLPIDVLFRPESLAKLPAPQRGKPILLVCKSGHTESMALGGLVALGYEPWVMRFGMIGWSAETQVSAGAPDQQPDTVRGVGGPVEK
jgi:rhodanese-related sulfurtransferase